MAARRRRADRLHRGRGLHHHSHRIDGHPAARARDVGRHRPRRHRADQAGADDRQAVAEHARHGRRPHRRTHRAASAWCGHHTGADRRRHCRTCRRLRRPDAGARRHLGFLPHPRGSGTRRRCRRRQWNRWAGRTSEPANDRVARRRRHGARLPERRGEDAGEQVEGLRLLRDHDRRALRRRSRPRRRGDENRRRLAPHRPRVPDPHPRAARDLRHRRVRTDAAGAESTHQDRAAEAVDGRA